MCTWMLLAAIASSLAIPAVARAPPPDAAPGPQAAERWNPLFLSGEWTYRSFHNIPTPVGDDLNRALDLIFAEAEFTFQTSSNGTLTGAIDCPGGGLNLQGTIRPGLGNAPLTVEIVGSGGPGTADWEYDYHGHLAHPWPSGINQVPALVGGVVRTKPHNGAPAGSVASFIAVKKL